MTREEAIARIKDHKIVHKMNEPRAIYISEALDMAIEALNREPCEDCISREDTLNKINALVAEYIPLMLTGWTLPLNIAKTINDMPPVTPKEESKNVLEYKKGYSDGFRDCLNKNVFCVDTESEA